MNKAEVIKRFKTEKLWFFKEGDDPTVWGIGTMLLPVQIEWEDDISPNV